MSRSSPTMPAPLSIRTGGRISSTLRPQWRGEAGLLGAPRRPPRSRPARRPRPARRASAARRSPPCPRAARAAAAAARRTPRGRTPAPAASRPAARGRAPARSRPAAGPPSRASRGRRSSRARRSGARPTPAGRRRRPRRRSAWRPRSAAAACVSGMCASSGLLDDRREHAVHVEQDAERFGSSFSGCSISSRVPVGPGTRTSMPPDGEGADKRRRLGGRVASTISARVRASARSAGRWASPRSA